MSVADRRDVVIAAGRAVLSLANCARVRHGLVAMLCLTLFPAFVALSHAADPRYALNFGVPASHWNEALDTTAVDARATAVLRYMACGREKSFLDSLESLHTVNSSDEEDAGEGLFDALVAKLAWIKRKGGDCSSDLADDDDQVSNREKAHFPGDCDGVLVNVAKHQTNVTEGCMRAQINIVIASVSQGDLQLGSSALPCYWTDPTHIFDGKHFTQTHGEWDATLRVLLRLYYLDAADRAGTVIVDDAANNRFARTNLRENLLSVDGAPAEESYSMFQCGNQERSTGSPQDRADDHSWADDALDSLGDLFDWFFKRLLLILAAAVALLALGIVAGPFVPLLVAIVTAAAVAGVAAVAVLRIPETENHLMQINSAKFLINQMILEDIGSGDAHHLPQDQDSTRRWLLHKMQSMVAHDFVEFNAMPYQRYTLGSIMNLHDFAHDDAMRAGAQVVLEYYMAKYAVGSSELRRYSPFRRRAENLKCYVEDLACDNAPARTVFDLTSGANHAVALMQFFAGPSWSLPAAPAPGDQSRLASKYSAGEMHFAATSSYQPQALTLELALNKSKPWLQRIRLLDGGAEIVSSSPSVLIGGGGVVTAHANSPFLAGITVPGFATSAISPDGDSDRGAGWPIVVIPHGHAADFMYFKDLIHFNGVRTDVAQQSAYMFDHNLCIWRNFACGIDLVLPDVIKNCVGGLPANGGWMFIDSHDARCAGSPYQNEQRFLVAIFVDRVQNGSSVSYDGFFEIVDADASSSFDSFVAAVHAKNPGAMSGIRGVYSSMSAHTILFDTRGHQLDSDHTGIDAIDGVKPDNLDNWPHADGEILAGPWSNAVVTITNPGYAPIAGASALPSSIKLDFSDWTNPHVDVIP